MEPTLEEVFEYDRQNRNVQPQSIGAMTTTPRMSAEAEAFEEVFRKWGRNDKRNKSRPL